MELQTLTMSGFRSYAVPILIDFRSVPHAAVVGNNGAGKSSILEAIEWALYGTSRSRDASGVITIGKTECEVELRFAIGGAAYLVKRTRQSRTKAGGGTLDLFACDGSNTCLSEKTIALTQVALTALIGTSRDIFLSCAMIKQGDHGRFTSASPSDRRALLREMLKLSKWDEVARTARERAANEARFVAMHEAELARPDAMTAPGELAVAVEAAAAFEDDIAATSGVLERAVEAHQELSRQAEDARRALGDVTMLEAAHGMAVRTLRAAEESSAAAVQRLKNASSRLDGALECEGIIAAAGGLELEGLESERSQIDVTLSGHGEAARAASDACSKLRGEWASTNAERRAVQKSIEQATSESAVIGEVPCDEPCGRKCPLLTLAHERRDSIADLRRSEARLGDLVSQLGVEGEREAARSRELTERHDQGMRRREQLNREIQELERPIIGATYTLKEIGSSAAARIDVDAATENAAACAESAAVARVGLDGTPRPDVEGLSNAMNEAVAVCATAASHVDNAKQRIHEYGLHIVKLQARVETLQARVDAIAERRQEMAGHQAAEHRWKRAVAAATVAPVLLIEEFAIPAIEDVANDVLGSISDGMSIRIETQRALKSGKGVSEKIDIIVRDGVGERPFEDFSGGEQFRVNIAIALALSSLAQHDSTSPPNCIFIDEGWGSLDRDGIAALSDVVAGLQEFYDIVWVITHVESAAECLPAQVRISCGAEGSTIECR